MKCCLLFLFMFLFACNFSYDEKEAIKVTTSLIDKQIRDSIVFKMRLDSLPELCFRFPVSDDVGKRYIISQKFNNDHKIAGTHLGIDIGDPGYSDADFGDTIYSISEGIVAKAQETDYLAVFYKYKGKFIKTLYFHCDTVFCRAGDKVHKGQPVATIGDSDGNYTAHLHLEMMHDTTLFFGGYGDTTGFMDPEEVLPYWRRK